MVFSSVSFLCIFLPAVLLGYYILPQKARNIFMLVASLAFYTCTGIKHLIFLVSSVIINFLFGIAIAYPARRGNKKQSRIFLVAAIIANIGALIYFKYTGMLVETFNLLTGGDAGIPEIILPLGISFYTFQCLSYLIDVYRTEGPEGAGREQDKVFTANIIDFAVYITMFPQLLQGPIIRFSDIKDALAHPSASIGEFAKGVERFIVGLAKKAVIANTLGEVCDQIFDIAPQYMSVSVAWLGALLYTLQIYFDFSGYTDMAIGLGHMFGFGYRENFNYPYISRSITEFWRRWHISLSNWFRDYLYIPLGGNRRGNVYFNLLVVFIATGIWHGAAWGFLVWGLWHGLFMLIERAVRGRDFPISVPAPVLSAFKWSYTMLAVMLGWVLFRIEDIVETLRYFKAMFGFDRSGYTAFSVGYFLDVRLVFFLVIAVLACIPWAQVMPVKISAHIANFAGSDKMLPRVTRHVCLIVLLVISFIFIVNSTYSPFIYFRF